MNMHRRHPKVSVTIYETDPGWSQFYYEAATAEVLKGLEELGPGNRNPERIKPTQTSALRQTVPLARDGFFNAATPSTEQPAALRGTTFKSWIEYNDAVRRGLATRASAELVAAAVAAPPNISPPPQGYELLFCLPGSRAAVYREIESGTICALKREESSYRKLW